jgi:phosphopantothenoylcysteine decarboxylase/phosphopantothenate--cysteine ligase
MNAAVADFRPDQVAAQKIKKHTQDGGMTLSLVPNPDILGELAERHDIFKVGFAAETQNILENATDKLARKGLDLILANEAVATMNNLDIQVTLLDANGNVTYLPQQTKEEAAAAIIDTISERLTMPRALS